MAAIDKQEFLNKCKAANPQFTASVFAALLGRIDAYNTALGRAASTGKITRESTLLTRLKTVNPKFDDSIVDNVREGSINYTGMMQQAKNSSAMQVEIEIQAMLRGFSPDVKAKYANALAYVQGKIKGSLAKPNDSAVYKMTVSISSRQSPLLLRGEGFPSLAAMEEVSNDLKIICPLVHELAQSEQRGPRLNWFARDSLKEVQSALVNLDKYLNGKCARISFKVLTVGDRCDNDKVGTGLAGQVLPTVMLKGEDRPDFRQENGYLQVPGGLRIFLGPLYFSVRANYDAILKTVAIYRFMTLFHEMTHKIIKTTDQVYELDNCRAIKDTPRAVMCADSWAYFLTDYAAEAGRLPGEKSSKVGALKARFGG